MTLNCDSGSFVVGAWVYLLVNVVLGMFAVWLSCFYTFACGYGCLL